MLSTFVPSGPAAFSLKVRTLVAHTRRGKMLSTSFWPLKSGSDLAQVVTGDLEVRRVPDGGQFADKWMGFPEGVSAIPDLSMAPIWLDAVSEKAAYWQVVHTVHLEVV